MKSLQLPNELLYFGNGQEALYYLATTQEQPFLILCDVNMPIMNGSELRRQINADKVLRQKSTPFIFLTTAANTQLVQEAYDNTVQGFFKKAPDYAGLEKQLERALLHGYVDLQSAVFGKPNCANQFRQLALIRASVC